MEKYDPEAPALALAKEPETPPPPTAYERLRQSETYGPLLVRAEEREAEVRAQLQDGRLPRSILYATQRTWTRPVAVAAEPTVPAVFDKQLQDYTKQLQESDTFVAAMQSALEEEHRMCAQTIQQLRSVRRQYYDLLRAYMQHTGHYYQDQVPPEQGQEQDAAIAALPPAPTSAAVVVTLPPSRVSSYIPPDPGTTFQASWNGRFHEALVCCLTALDDNDARVARLVAEREQEANYHALILSEWRTAKRQCDALLTCYTDALDQMQHQDDDEQEEEGEEDDDE
jgi:hypothetical protein